MSNRSASVPRGDPQRVIQDCETKLAGRPAPPDDTARAATLLELGWAYRCLERGDRGGNLRRAIGHFDEALRFYSATLHPWEWGRALYRRGVACAELPDSGDDGLREAITCFTRALEAHTRERYPERWACLHGKLGLAHAQLALGDRVTNLKTAVGHYELALQHYTRESDPVRWARVHCDLAMARDELAVITGDTGLLGRPELRAARVRCAPTAVSRTRAATAAPNPVSFLNAVPGAATSKSCGGRRPD